MCTIYNYLSILYLIYYNILHIYIVIYSTIWYTIIDNKIDNKRKYPIKTIFSASVAVFFPNYVIILMKSTSTLGQYRRKGDLGSEWILLILFLLEEQTWVPC